MWCSKGGNCSSSICQPFCCWLWAKAPSPMRLIPATRPIAAKALPGSCLQKFNFVMIITQVVIRVLLILRIKSIPTNLLGTSCVLSAACGRPGFWWASVIASASLRRYTSPSAISTTIPCGCIFRPPSGFCPTSTSHRTFRPCPPRIPLTIYH